jgi:hypothetical protein
MSGLLRFFEFAGDGQGMQPRSVKFRCRFGATQDLVLGNFSRPFGTFRFGSGLPRTCVLGYFQPSLRDWVPAGPRWVVSFVDIRQPLGQDLRAHSEGLCLGCRRTAGPSATLRFGPTARRGRRDDKGRVVLPVRRWSVLRDHVQRQLTEGLVSMWGVAACEAGPFLEFG